VGGWVKREGREEINVYLYMLICMVGFWILNEWWVGIMGVRRLGVVSTQRRAARKQQRLINHSFHMDGNGMDVRRRLPLVISAATGKKGRRKWCEGPADGEINHPSFVSHNTHHQITSSSSQRFIFGEPVSNEQSHQSINHKLPAGATGAHNSQPSQSSHL
jgi:hypothetical protein